MCVASCHATRLNASSVPRVSSVPGDQLQVAEILVEGEPAELTTLRYASEDAPSCSKRPLIPSPLLEVQNVTFESLLFASSQAN